MDRANASRTSDIAAVMRALHQTHDGEPKILVDPIAPMLVEVGSLDPNWIGPILAHPFAPQWRASFAIRSRYTEDCLGEAVAEGARQYLILGAGLDTFAYRQPAWAKAIRIFEIDHPATQGFKRSQLSRAGIRLPVNLSFVPTDFERTSIRQALDLSAFAFDERSFCAWLGVTQYLTRDAIEATLRFTLSLPRKTEIVLSFILPQDALTGVEADAVAIAAAKSAGAGEPWLSRFEPDELISVLQRLGFARIIHLTPKAAADRYLKQRTDGLTGRRGEQLVRAVV